MPDELKKLLSRELDELKQHKLRATALGVCVVVLLIVWTIDDSSGGEEIILNDAPPVTKDLPVKSLPVKPLPVAKSPDGVTVVLGANADALFIGDPFAGEEKPKPKPTQPTTTPLPTIPPPQVVIQPPAPPQPPQLEKPKELLTLTGTAISGDNKTAMILRGKETLFLTIGDVIDGRQIVDITPDFVTLDDGEVLTIRNME